MILIRNQYQHLLSMKLRNAKYNNLKIICLKFYRNKFFSMFLKTLTSFVIAFLIIFSSIIFNGIKNIYSENKIKIFYPLPNDNFNNVFSETQDLMLRKSDLEVPSKLFIFLIVIISINVLFKNILFSLNIINIIIVY